MKLFQREQSRIFGINPILFLYFKYSLKFFDPKVLGKARMIFCVHSMKMGFVHAYFPLLSMTVMRIYR